MSDKIYMSSNAEYTTQSLEDLKSIMGQLSAAQPVDHETVYACLCQLVVSLMATEQAKVAGFNAYTLLSARKDTP